MKKIKKLFKKRKLLKRLRKEYLYFINLSLQTDIDYTKGVITLDEFTRRINFEIANLSSIKRAIRKIERL